MTGRRARYRRERVRRVMEILLAEGEANAAKLVQQVEKRRTTGKWDGKKVKKLLAEVDDDAGEADPG